MKRFLHVIVAFLLLFLNSSVLRIAAEISGDYEYKVVDGTAKIINYKGAGKNVEIPSILDGYSVTNIGDFAFNRRLTLSSIIIPSSVTNIGIRSFYGCYNLNSVTIPNGVTHIGESAFIDCTALTSVTIPESVTSIDRFAFSGCTSLTSVNILSSIIGENMFFNCSALTTVNMGGNLKFIGDEAFGNCKAIETIIIPESVTELNYGSFVRCSSLKTVIFNNPNTEFKETPGKAHPHAVLVPTFYQTDNLSTVYAFSGSQAQRFTLNKQLNFIPIAGVQLNGQKIQFDMPPIIKQGRVLVPVRKIFEALEANINWDGDTGTVTAEKADKMISIKVGNNQMTVNGETIILDVPPQIHHDRTLVPIRAVSTSLGATIEWNDEMQLVMINI